jgi:hypothetical protein
LSVLAVARLEASFYQHAPLEDAHQVIAIEGDAIDCLRVKVVEEEFGEILDGDDAAYLVLVAHYGHGAQVVLLEQLPSRSQWGAWTWPHTLIRDWGKRAHQAVRKAFQETVAHDRCAHP